MCSGWDKRGLKKIVGGTERRVRRWGRVKFECRRI
jgi:hypothetical protein